MTIAAGRGVPEPTQVADSLTPANVMITFVPAPPTITVPRSLAVTRLVSLAPYYPPGSRISCQATPTNRRTRCKDKKT